MRNLLSKYLGKIHSEIGRQVLVVMPVRNYSGNDTEGDMGRIYHQPEQF